MTAHAHARIATVAMALAASVEDRGQRQVGAIIGHAGSTLSRWGGDAGAWSASALISLALADDGVRAAVLEALREGDEPAPRSEAPRTTCVSTACAAIAKMSAMAGHLAADLADGLIRPKDAVARRPEIRALIEGLRRLDRELAAVAGARS